jgi:hypothetical protein
VIESAQSQNSPDPEGGDGRYEDADAVQRIHLGGLSGVADFAPRERPMRKSDHAGLSALARHLHAISHMLTAWARVVGDVVTVTTEGPRKAVVLPPKLLPPQ